MLNRVFEHSSEQMSELPDDSVALMVTSPPYHVGKEYDGDGTFQEYLSMIKRVLAETYRVLAAWVAAPWSTLQTWGVGPTYR